MVSAQRILIRLSSLKASLKSRELWSRRIIMSEIFPEHIRGTAASVATCINWICSFILTESFSAMTDGLTQYGTFWFFAGITASVRTIIETFVEPSNVIDCVSLYGF